MANRVPKPLLLRVLTGAALGVCASLVSGQPGLAQEVAPAPTLDLELNAQQPSQKGCRFTFVIANRLGVDLRKAAFEIALFDDRGAVQTLAVLDFKDLMNGKTKVTRFDLPGLDCVKISRVLINHATECVGDGIEASTCIRRLKPASRTRIDFGV